MTSLSAIGVASSARGGEALSSPLCGGASCLARRGDASSSERGSEPHQAGIDGAMVGTGVWKGG